MPGRRLLSVTPIEDPDRFWISRSDWLPDAGSIEFRWSEPKYDGQSSSKVWNAGMRPVRVPGSVARFDSEPGLDETIDTKLLRRDFGATHMRRGNAVLYAPHRS
jgi:hypothetical protein